VVDPDGDGSAAPKVERFVYDGEDIALVFDGSGNQTHRYLHGLEIDQVLADENAQGEVLWPLTDNLGTVRDLVGSSGTLLNQLTYDSFGNVTSESNAAVDHRFRYTGRELDEETGLYYYRARYYDPVVGRFISEDPIGFEAGDTNLYRYVGNSPVNATDPEGLYLLRVGDDPCSPPSLAPSPWLVAGPGGVPRPPKLPGPFHLIFEGLFPKPALAPTAPPRPPRGGKNPVLEGQKGVQRAIQELKGAGYTVIGKEITVDVNVNRKVLRTRIDLLVEKSEIRMFVEVKNGPKAALTTNQRLGFPEIRKSGGVIRGVRGMPAG